MIESTLLSHADNQRYCAHFKDPRRLWPLTHVELEVALYVFSTSPALRTISYPVGTLIPVLRVNKLLRWAGNDPSRRMLMGMALCVITIIPD